MNPVVGTESQPDGVHNKWGKPTSKHYHKPEPLQGQNSHLKIVREQAGLGTVLVFHGELVPRPAV